MTDKIRDLAQHAQDTDDGPLGERGLHDVAGLGAVWFDAGQLELLHESPSNPRHLSDDARQRLAYSLEHAPRMLRSRPIIATTEGEVVAGNMRLRVSKELGTGTWVAIEQLTDAEKREWMLRDNQEYGDWVPDELAALIKLHADEGDDLQLLGFAEPEIDELLAMARENEGGAGIAGQVTAGPSLADRFVVPPFTVLDARRGEWRGRKGEWLSLGIKSELGRTGENIGKAALHATSANDPRFYEAKRAKEAALGRALSTEEFLRDHYRTPDRDDSALAEGGTSVFDPVLCELAYRWFSPEGGLVLDPFAGGSVRGVVAAMLGRRYLGVDLREAQVDANRQQAQEILGAVTQAPLDPPEQGVHDPAAATPVERRGGVLVKRDDVFTVGGAPGGKARTCLALAMAGLPSCGPGAGLVTAGSRHSPQVNIVARVAKSLGVPCRVHTPEGEPGPEVQEAVELGAERVAHKPGHNTVIVARARDDAEKRRWVHIPFGMEHPEAVEQTARQAEQLPWGEFARIVVPVGSGMSLAGIIHGRQRAGASHVPILGVVVGADPRKRLAKFDALEVENVLLVEAGVPYDEHVHADLGGLELDPVYEAKCAAHLQDGDLLWIVGKRPSMGDSTPGTGPRGIPQGDRPVPTWMAGDSLQVLPQLRDSGEQLADLVFSCPPYHDLEKYSDDERDLSAQGSYADFRHLHEQIIAEACSLLAVDRFAVWVVGDVRDKKTGIQLPLVADTIRAFEAAGLSYYGEAIYVTPVGSLRIRAAKAFITGRKLGRTHQQMLVFVKGDPRAAADAAGPVDAAAIADAADNAAEE